jgi:ABC-type multidrug transport system ATPase subunit
VRPPAARVQLQESALPLFIKVGEAMELFASFYRQPADPAELLEALGLTAERKAVPLGVKRSITAAPDDVR